MIIQQEMKYSIESINSEVSAHGPFRLDHYALLDDQFPKSLNH